MKRILSVEYPACEGSEPSLLPFKCNQFLPVSQRFCGFGYSSLRAVFAAVLAQAHSLSKSKNPRS